MTADVARVLHDAVDEPTFDSSHTGTSEFRVTCGCGEVSWGFNDAGARAEHRRHRSDVASQLALALALLSGAVGGERKEAA